MIDFLIADTRIVFNFCVELFFAALSPCDNKEMTLKTIAIVLICLNLFTGKHMDFPGELIPHP